MENHHDSGKYVIVFLLKGNIKKDHKNLADRLAKKYKLRSVSETVDAHITLKGFRTLLNQYKVKDIEELLKQFCKNHSEVKLQLKGISNFGRRVIFMDVIPSYEMKKIYNDFTREMDKIGWMEWNEFDKERIHFHATLVEGKEDLEEFDDILDFAKKEKPEFNLKMDNISILTKPKDRWVLYKRFKLLKA